MLPTIAKHFDPCIMHGSNDCGNLRTASQSNHRGYAGVKSAARSEFPARPERTEPDVGVSPNVVTAYCVYTLIRMIKSEKGEGRVEPVMSTKIFHLLSGQQGIYFLGARGGLPDGEFGVASPALPNRLSHL